MRTENGFEYRGQYTNEISFPLGGIGTGCIGLAGNGRLKDFEIYNRPNKCTYQGFTHFAVKAEQNGCVLDARVLNGDVPPHFIGDINEPDRSNSYGFGVNRSTLAGCPHFQQHTFTGGFPFAQIDFQDSQFPGAVRLIAFNPFIPLGEKDSSLPAAFFEVEFTNDTNLAITYTAAFSVSNPSPDQNVHTKSKEGEVTYITLGNSKCEAGAYDYGELCVSTDCQNAHAQQYWFRGRWFDELGVFWQDFSKAGPLTNRQYAPEDKQSKPDTATLAACVTVAPGASERVRFILSWYYPNFFKYWKGFHFSSGDELRNAAKWKNYYASLFDSAKDCALYAFSNYNRLLLQTRLFQNTLFSSTLPDSVLDAVSANLSVLKSPTCLRLEDGTFYAFEGCTSDCGFCEGSCSHVWNYAYALPFLFPALERSMREADFRYNMNEHGGMSFRLQLPLGIPRANFRPCADGQFGGVIKVYREWKLSADDAWLAKMWPYVKKNIEFAWSEHNADKWDIDRTGVLHGRQHHTLDMELFGPNSWLTGFYLAALKAAAQMGEYLGETETAAEYLALFEKGRAWTQQHLFNGEFFYQQIDLKDMSILDQYENTLAYRNEESGEIKYQVGEGSSIDQVVAQWHANICGIGEIFDKDKVKKALNTIYQYNFKKSLRNFFNPCRLFALADESCTVICDWPNAAQKPVIPVPYSEEAMTGFEYQAAVHMLQEGMTEQGTQLIEAIRNRFDGYRRNPWNEFEAGSNYARSMASYSALLAFSGFSFDLPQGKIGFSPIHPEAFQSFWSVGSGWGQFSCNQNQSVLSVLYGSLSLSLLSLAFMKPAKVTLEGKLLDFTLDGDTLVFASKILIREGERLVVESAQERRDMTKA